MKFASIYNYCSESFTRMKTGKTPIKNIFFIIALAIMATSCQSYCLRPGNLLFHVAEKSNAITEVTPGMIDHVAIVITKDSVIEAVGRGVVTTPLDSLLAQSGHYIVAKVRNADRQQSIRNARKYLGRSYDYLYLPDNADIYCSELVQISFVDRHQRPLFSTIPMSFHDNTGNITPYWRDFYARHDLDVPEGKPGTNPAELLQRKEIKKGKGTLKSKK